MKNGHHLQGVANVNKENYQILINNESSENLLVVLRKGASQNQKRHSDGAEEGQRDETGKKFIKNLLNHNWICENLRCLHSGTKKKHETKKIKFAD